MHVTRSIRLPVPAACAAALLAAGLTLVHAPRPAHAADGPSPANAGPPMVPAEVTAGDVTLRLYPNQISIDRSRRFDDQGKTTQRNNRLSMYFQCAVTTERTVLAYRDGGVDRLRDGWDREVALPAPNDRGRGNNWVTLQPNRHRGRNDGATQFSFGFNTDTPAEDVQVLSEVGGRIELKVADGDLRAIRLAPLGDYLGKRLRIRDMDDLQIVVERTDERGEQGVRLSLPAEWMPQIRAVRFLSAEGRVLPGGDSSRQRRQGAIESRTYRNAPADDATMEIQVFPGVEVIEVPWTVRDVPLPASEEDGAVGELALDTEALGGGPQIPALEVEIED